MEFDLSKIEMSNSDIKRGIKLPESLSSELAEFIGVVIGDGHLSYYPRLSMSGHKIVSIDVRIACNVNEQHYINYIKNLFQNLFNKSLDYFPDKRSQAVILRLNSRGVVLFLNRICGLPLNRKTDNVAVPNIIKNADNDIKYAFLRGLADTDFSLIFRFRHGKGYSYPTIKAGFKSKRLVKDLELLFKELGFQCSTNYDLVKPDKRFGPTTINYIYLYGRINFKKWLDSIGFSNSKFQRKVEKWQKEGICPPGY